MSEQKTVSPLLDGFVMGNPMSDHDGVRCCPAIKENSDNKYIVKIISIPASQVQMDALLLAGAYKDPSGAMDYYKEQADEVAAEAELLQKLSGSDGFLPYEGWQIEPITKRRLGYEVYLLSSYKRSLEKHLHKSPVTHLEAMNMGMDICDALSVCRQAGSIYMDLKPSNIFISSQKEYRIGDLGFLPLDSLHFMTLPSKYCSCYTPPEFEDPMAPLNTTADTYALGMVLYQLYNDSQLPSREDIQNGTVPMPVNADYELAEIIMTAIHTDPTQRWQDPAAMRQALVAYMQRNAVNDVPITPHTPLEVPDAPAVEEIPAEQAEEPQSEVAEAAGESLSADEESSEASVSADTAPAETEQPEESQDAPLPAAEEDADLLPPHEMSEELSKIVAQADDLIAYEMPEDIVIPEAPEAPDPFAFAAEGTDEVDDSDIPLDPLMEDESADSEKPEKKKKKSQRFVSPKRKRRVRRFFTTLLFLATMSAVGLCGYLYYQLFYLIPVESITIQGTEQSLTVTIETEAEESRIRVRCSDIYGNVRTSGVSNGMAAFADLLPKTEYTIALEIDGFNKLSGETRGTFTTDANTHIVSFTSVTGPEDGSLVLNFTVDGEESDRWTVIASAEGEREIRESFSGHSVTIKHLTVGKVYTMTLQSEDDLALSGMTSIECLATRTILAEDLTVSTENGTDLIVSWRSPGDVVIGSWDVRCYNSQGFDTQLTVKETSAVIPNVNLAAGYTIEVTASGMTHPARISITKEPIIIENFTIGNAEDPTKTSLQLSWQFTGLSPRDGWLVLYTVDGATTPTVITSDEPNVEVFPRIPGAKYRFTIQSPNATSVLNSVHTFECPEPETFNNYSLSADTVTAHLLQTPEKSNWSYESISDSDFTDTFSIGDRISVVLQAEAPFYLPGNETRILYVYTDAHGNALSDLTRQEKAYWKNIWSGGDAKTGELDVPSSPDSVGSYILNIYFDGMLMSQVPFTVQ